MFLECYSSDLLPSQTKLPVKEKTKMRPMPPEMDFWVIPKFLFDPTDLSPWCYWKHKSYLCINKNLKSILHWPVKVIGKSISEINQCRKLTWGVDIFWSNYAEHDHLPLRITFPSLDIRVGPGCHGDRWYSYPSDKAVWTRNGTESKSGQSVFLSWEAGIGIQRLLVSLC